MYMDLNLIINRAKNMILTPVTEWEAVKQEAKPHKEVLMNYVLPFIILVGACSFLGRLLFHLQFFGVGRSLLFAIIQMVTVLGVLYITVWVVNELATNFGSQKNFDAAFRLVAYSNTAFFVAASAAGLLAISFLSALLSLCGLYSLYLMWTGFTPMMATPEDKKAGYVIISLLVLIVAYFVIGAILGMIMLGSAAGYAVVR